MEHQARSCTRLRMRFTIPVVLVAIMLSLLSVPHRAQGGSPSQSDGFQPVSDQGFGDRQNSWAWSMQWWRGALYVGTNRAFQCVQAESFEVLFGTGGFYPPSDPNIECTEEPEDLPLQAEIWRWRPSDLWKRVYQSPKDVPVPGSSPPKFIARDIGYRGMTIFKEPDGTEALYVGAVSPRPIGYDVPPRILRSTNGVNFEPLPQEPGTVLGDFPLGSFRGLTTFDKKLYLVGGTIEGSGMLMEAADPRGGNDNFRQVGPPDVEISAVMPYNGQLYVGTRDLLDGYAVLRTDAQGTPPYDYIPVVEEGGYLPNPNPEVLAMHVFNNRLYVGLNAIDVDRGEVKGAAELIRINADNTWDLVAGTARQTPVGRKRPLSGFGAGWGSQYNAHMWQIETFDGALYVGTLDTSTTITDTSSLEPGTQLGFDLYRSSDGVNFEAISVTGFGDKFNYGVRGLEPTPHGLFLGTANPYYGLNIYRSDPPANVEYLVYLPFVHTTNGDP